MLNPLPVQSAILVDMEEVENYPRHVDEDKELRSNKPQKKSDIKRSALVHDDVCLDCE